jgi:hypothetical protein
MFAKRGFTGESCSCVLWVETLGAGVRHPVVLGA